MNAPVLLQSLVLTLRHFGLQGLVVLVDEVESVLSLRRPQREESYRTLRLLVDRQKLPNRTLIVSFTTPTMFTDTERGMRAAMSAVLWPAFGWPNSIAS